MTRQAVCVLLHRLPSDDWEMGGQEFRADSWSVCLCVFDA